MTNNNDNDKDQQDLPQHEKPPARAGLRFRQMLSTILFGALGVQSNKARERDFTEGKLSHFIYFGLGFMLLFTLGIIGVVKLVLYIAGR